MCYASGFPGPFLQPYSWVCSALTHTRIHNFILYRILTTGAQPSKTELNHKTGPSLAEKVDEGETKDRGRGAKGKPEGLRVPQPPPLPQSSDFYRQAY